MSRPKDSDLNQNWSCLYRDGESTMMFSGPGGAIRAEVFQGWITRELWYGLRALESSTCRNALVRKWSVKAPPVFAGSDNRGKNRHFLTINAPEQAQVVLHFFSEVPEGLLYALERALKPVVKEEPSNVQECQRGEKVRHLPGDPTEPVQGQRRKRGRPKGSGSRRQKEVGG